MRYMLHSVQMDGVVVIGEGEKDEAPMLYNGEQIGDGSPPQVDIAVDPLEGTTLAAHGMPSALAVIALSARGTMFDPGPCVYMEKMAGAPEIADLLDLDRPLGETVRLVAERKGCAGRRRDGRGARPAAPRARASRRSARPGARVRLIAHGDVSAALLAVTERSPVDLLWGIGGTPEGVISAAAVKCLGGQLLGRLWPRDDEERTAARDAGYDLERVLDRDDLVAGDDVFFSATGVTDGDVLAGRALSERGRRDDRIARDALALGHDPADPRHARPREAARGRRRALLASGRIGRVSPERLWRLSAWLRRRGLRRLAMLVKKINSAIYHNSLAPGASFSPDVHFGHHGFGTVIHSQRRDRRARDRSARTSRSRCAPRQRPRIAS